MNLTSSQFEINIVQSLDSRIGFRDLLRLKEWFLRYSYPTQLLPMLLHVQVVHVLEHPGRRVRSWQVEALTNSGVGRSMIGTGITRGPVSQTDDLLYEVSDHVAPQRERLGHGGDHRVVLFLAHSVHGGM